MGMVSGPIGTLVTVLNPFTAIHLLDGMFPSGWVPETLTVQLLRVELSKILDPNGLILNERINYVSIPD
ncbi:hypothetical protein DSO57_1000467 [Entomophthora muscae]|uniref:Uncharacterized protein n=1 Tax=Entomophthora muscae TaxID=34485 RepID=A0ACC2UVG7_9FUNG|nr:hypothetical protein DSO57_1000467 [Entomophthora muscae]